MSPTRPPKGPKLPPLAHADPKVMKRRQRAYDPNLDADALRLWRVSKNVVTPIWSQVYVANWLGVSVRMVRRWENNKYPVPLYISKRIHEYEEMLAEIESLKRTLRLNNISP